MSKGKPIPTYFSTGGEDADLAAIAALDSATANALATDGAGWIRKTYAQLKTALGLDAAAGAYTQTYATADKTHATPTAVAVAVTGATNAVPYGYSQAQANAIVAAANTNRADHLDLAQLVNAVIDDLQSRGLLS